jgi:hypothetical protein
MLGRPRCRGEYNIKIDLEVIGYVQMDWIHLAEDRGKWQVVGTRIMNF